YDDSEPNWNEYPYFVKVEDKRGQTGCHINARLQQFVLSDVEGQSFRATPGIGRTDSSDARKQFAEHIVTQGARVVLSGIGGDEVTGGVPTETPEIQDLLSMAHVGTLIHQLKIWALNKRRPWFLILLEAGMGFLPEAFIRRSRQT